jgi:chorismate synthase
MAADENHKINEVVPVVWTEGLGTAPFFGMTATGLQPDAQPCTPRTYANHIGGITGGITGGIRRNYGDTLPIAPIS